jgi:hypothetical protein
MRNKYVLPIRLYYPRVYEELYHYSIINKHPYDIPCLFKVFMICGHWINLVCLKTLTPYPINTSFTLKIQF